MASENLENSLTNSMLEVIKFQLPIPSISVKNVFSEGGGGGGGVGEVDVMPNRVKAIFPSSQKSLAHMIFKFNQ